MADLQKQIDRIGLVLSSVMEWITLIDFTFHGAIDRDHADTLPGVSLPEPPGSDEHDALLTRLSDLSTELHEIAHTVISVDGEVVSDNLAVPLFSLGFANAFS